MGPPLLDQIGPPLDQISPPLDLPNALANGPAIAPDRPALLGPQNEPGIGLSRPAFRHAKRGTQNEPAKWACCWAKYARYWARQMGSALGQIGPLLSPLNGPVIGFAKWARHWAKCANHWTSKIGPLLGLRVFYVFGNVAYAYSGQYDRRQIQHVLMQFCSVGRVV
jgi:hypothetical protein